jgi:hypothetical protein
MVDGYRWWSFAPKDVKGREEAIFEAVQKGLHVPVSWFVIKNSVWVGGVEHTAEISVAADALRIGGVPNGIRVSVTPRLAQRVADHLGSLLPTTKVCDLINSAAVARKSWVKPQIQPSDTASRMAHGMSPSMSDNDAVASHSRKVDSLARLPLVANAGKDWVLTNGYKSRLGSAANYGWFDPAAPYISSSGLRLWQQLGFAHNADHVDYSQVLRLVHPKVKVDGTELDFRYVAKDPVLCRLVSDEGPLEYFEIPSTRS